MTRRIHRLGFASLPLISGLLFYFSYHPVDAGPLAWFALAPLIIFVMKESRGWRAFLLAWAGGCAFFVPGFAWLRHTGGWSFVLVGIVLGLFWAAFAPLMRALCARARFPVPVAAPCAWVALEFLRDHFPLNGLPWYLAGYTQHAVLPVIQIADLAGPWSVSLLLLFVNGVVARAFLEARHQPRWAMAATGLVLLSFAYGFVRLATIEMTEGPRIGLVQPNVPQDIKNLSSYSEETDPILIRHERLTRDLAASERRLDLILWPESVVLVPIAIDRESTRWYGGPLQERYAAVAKGAGVPLLMGTQVVEVSEGKPVASTNSAVLFDREGRIAGRYDKVRLVPFSEYLPLQSILPVQKIVRAVSGITLYEFRPGRDFPLFEAGGVRFGVTICAEAMYPEISREIARKGVPLIVNISNDGWFRDSAELDHMLAMARFRAIENRVHYVRATNTGISAFIEPTGRLQKVLAGPVSRLKEIEGTLAADVRLARGGSPYRALGDAAAWLCAGAAVSGLALAAARRFGSKD